MLPDENDLVASDRLLVADAVRLGLKNPDLTVSQCLRVDRPDLSDEDCERLAPYFLLRQTIFLGFTRDAGRRGPPS